MCILVMRLTGTYNRGVLYNDSKAATAKVPIIMGYYTTRVKLPQQRVYNRGVLYNESKAAKATGI
jgi:hypothetical protein